MNILHTSEYRSIVRQHYYSLPKNINSFNQFELCSKLIKDIPIKKLNEYFIHHIKQRNVVSNDVLMFKNFKEFKQLGNGRRLFSVFKFFLVGVECNNPYIVPSIGA
jgi:hypothetical protein